MRVQAESFHLNDSNPVSLADKCVDVLVNNLRVITYYNVATRTYSLRRGIRLPAPVCDKLLEEYQNRFTLTDGFANLFQDSKRTKLTIVKLRNTQITHIGLECLLAHKPLVVELVECNVIIYALRNVIHKFGGNIVNLNIGQLSHLNSQTLAHMYIPNENQTVFKNLRRLTMHYLNIDVMPSTLMTSLENLTHLDLAHVAQGISQFGHLRSLQSLVLHNIQYTEENITWICQQQNLIHLDISHDYTNFESFLDPNKTLHMLVRHLKKLMSLDISGSNLAGAGAGTATIVEDGDSNQIVHTCDIPGLVTRVGLPLEFLGLYGTANAACRRHDIPAIIISGDKDEAQILAAARAYFGRPTIMTRVLNDLYHLFRDERVTNIQLALGVVLKAMETYLRVVHIQISGSAILFYIVKSDKRALFGLRLKRRIITILLNAMEAHIRNETLIRNASLTLCQFKMPVDVLYEYERIVQLLLIVSETRHQWFVQRIAIYLLNALACQVEGRQKQFLGDKGAISKMLHVIAERLERRVCDEVMEVAWSTMWNVTDETPQNCQRFLDNRGMLFFRACLKYFPDNVELVRNMLGLIGNVAEVPFLRPQLMYTGLLTVFYDLLNSESDGIEVSYNAAGVLAHLASDGPAAWTAASPSRDAVLKRITSAVKRWNRKAERNINYRSFQPILTLLKTYHTPQCQHWAAWALSNLTTVYPEKYCKLVEKEQGIEILSEVINRPGLYAIKELARNVIENCVQFAARAEPPAAEVQDN
ncbi:unnamed protein product [Leptosia nina]|uniref:Protein zer-1 homolog n=1 Tax=Leptosia nina TaxID=320188 RepID=A0AAV1K1J9_9NEOP